MVMSSRSATLQAGGHRAGDKRLLDTLFFKGAGKESSLWGLVPVLELEIRCENFRAARWCVGRGTAEGSL